MSNVLPIESADTYARRIASVRAIGSADNSLARMTADIVSVVPAGFDPTVRGAVAGLVHEYLSGCACHSKTCTCGLRPAVKSPAKATTTYGTGHDTLTRRVKAALSSGTPKPAVLRVSLSGEGGGSVTIAPDHPFYADLVALVKGS